MQPSPGSRKAEARPASPARATPPAAQEPVRAAADPYALLRVAAARAAAPLPEADAPESGPEREAEGARALAATPAAGTIPAPTAFAPPAREAPPAVREVLAAPGEPLDGGARAALEPRFGRSFADVRVHADARAAASARAVDAVAYTSGRDVVFAEGRYAPATDAGRGLLAHELTHVLQQAGAAAPAEPGTRLQRQQRDPPPGNAAAAPTPAQVYAQALAAVRQTDATVHGYLAAAPLNGAATVVRTERFNTADTPPVAMTVTFNLTVVSRPLGAGEQARFTHGNPALTQTPGAANMAVPMVVEVAPQAPVADLTRSLYHEGLHMLLYMDSFLPQRSSHYASLANYTRLARAHAESAMLLAEVEVYIELDLQTRAARPPQPGAVPTPAPPAGYARRAANELFTHLLEEKYVRDQENARYGGTTANRSFTLTYLLHDLRDMGVNAQASDRNFVSIVDRATRILDSVDAQLRAPAPPQAPAPGQSGSARPAAPPANPPPPRSP